MDTSGKTIASQDAEARNKSRVAKKHRLASLILRDGVSAVGPECRPLRNHAPASSVCMSQCSFDQNRTPCNFRHSMTAETALQISTTAIAGKQRSETNHDSRQDRYKRGWFGEFTVSAPTTTDSAASTTAGLADGPNTTWRKEHVRVAEASARPASLNFERIKKALGNVELAEFRFVAAHNHHAQVVAHSQHAQNAIDESRKVYNEAKAEYRNAQIELGRIIAEETNRLARDSSVYPRGHGLKNCGELRRGEQKILDKAEHPNERDQLEKAICENRSLRAARELIALSQTKAKHPLNNTQTSEGRHIIADGTDAVTGKREGDDDLTREEVTKNQLDRLSKLLETITTRVDSVTGQVHKFDKDLYNQLTENIRATMGHLDPANNQSFDDLVTKYRPS